MNSIFANIFQELQTRITAQVPLIRWIDQDLGQLEHYGERPPVSWPCVLIDFEGFNYEDMGDLCQSAQGVIMFRLAFPPYSASNNLTPVSYLQQALNFYELEYSLHQALHGWSGDPTWGALTRISALTEKRDDNIRVRVLRYSIAFEDYNTAPVTTPHGVPPVKFQI